MNLATITQTVSLLSLPWKQRLDSYVHHKGFLEGEIKSLMQEMEQLRQRKMENTKVKIGLTD
jgi:hypothetical protein